jgi:inner membrane protein
MQKILGQKLLLIGFIGLLLWLPLLWILGQVNDRSSYQYTVQQEVASSWTGAQTLMTPVLVVQYEHKVRRVLAHTETGTTYKEELENHQIFLPAEAAEVRNSMVTEMRYKGIYSVPVYRTDLEIEGNFSPRQLQEQIVQLQEKTNFVRLTSTYLAVHVRDPRGIEGKPELTWRGQPREFLPGSGLAGLHEGMRTPITDDFAAATDLETPLTFSARFTLRGMEMLQLLPAARQFSLAMDATWPHPEFFGAFLPVEREINAEGFNARWSINEFATSIGDKLASCAEANCDRLMETQFGVNLFQSVDVYQQTERAIKYAFLFIALTFAVFFIFETLQRAPIHPIQYIFVGLALVIFYLLLLSLSEHLAFAKAYAIAGGACCALNGFYVRYVMRGWRPALLFTGALVSLYAVLFVILRMEDYAQLTGAILIFAMLATAMLLTRKIDWYQISAAPK